jgi:hypothetical protein
MRSYSFCEKCKKTGVKLYQRRGGNGVVKFLCWPCYEEMGQPTDSPVPYLSRRGATLLKNHRCKTMGISDG